MSANMMHDDGATPADGEQTRPAPRLPTLAELGPRFEAFVATLERPLVFFDIEATGADPIADRIIELSAVRVGATAGVEPPRTWRIDPGVKIPSEASDIHGIYNG